MSLYVAVMCSNGFLSCPLSSKMSKMFLISALRLSGEEERRYARQISPLKVAETVS